jgi:predicted nucleic-acid-binding Zn-ribbon protein
MKNGQCPKCGSHEVFSNTNRRFPALNTITIGSGNFGNRYAYLDTYVCVCCGYVENYVAKQGDLNHIKEEWALVRPQSEVSNVDSSNLGFVPVH